MQQQYSVPAAPIAPVTLLPAATYDPKFLQSTPQAFSPALTTSSLELYKIIDGRINQRKDELFQDMHPVGSIFASATPLQELKFGSSFGKDSNIIHTFHGCKFQLLPPNTFLKNVDYSVEKKEEDSTFSVFPSEKGGNIGSIKLPGKQSNKKHSDSKGKSHSKALLSHMTLYLYKRIA